MATEPKIIFEDDTILVLDKPAGLVVNRSETAKEPTVQDWLADYFSLPEGEGGVGNRAGIVHRLDRATSGILLVGKTEQSYVNLQLQFKNRSVKKSYKALVHGLLCGRGKISESIARNPFNRTRFITSSVGREAETLWTTEENFKLKDNFFQNLSRRYAASFIKDYSYFALVNVFPKTGRTHQIRVHFKHIGHSVVSDDLYGGRKFLSLDRLWCSRLFLHAAGIAFTHPTNGKKLAFNSSLPQDLKDALANLAKD